MPRIAILGGGISGLTAAYELEQHRRAGAALDWHLFEATSRLGGTVSTTRLTTPGGDFVLEDGPDGWLTEKPWARELATELGLGPELLPCNEAEKRTYLYLDGRLTAMPARMRLMVPEDLATLEDSPLFTPEARQAYAAELGRADELKASIPGHDESVASFVLRHFGPEVLAKVAAPLLSGVFGGDVERLSVRAVMPQFVAMERTHGSLIAALQSRTPAPAVTSPVASISGLAANPNPRQATFTSLRGGMGSLVDALVAVLPADRLRQNSRAYLMEDAGWCVLVGKPYREFLGGVLRTYRSRSLNDFIEPFDHIIFATTLDATRAIFPDSSIAHLLPTEASSALLVTLCWPAETAGTVTVPPGFGFLVPQDHAHLSPQLLAATFVDQKYPHRAPAGGKVLRAFFGSASAEHLARLPDPDAVTAALAQLRRLLGPLPDPDPTLTTVRRWPRSLPQYEVGHLDRMARLKERVAALPGLHLLGNSYHGVGIPDLIRDARATARRLAESLA